MKQVYHDPNKPIENEEELNVLYSNKRENEAIKKTYAGEKEKMAGMDRKTRLEYIINYYKWPILGVVGGIALIIYIVVQVLTKVSPAFYIDVVNSSFVNDSREDAITEYLEMARKERADIQSAVNREANFEAGAVYSQFDIFTIANQIDVIFSDEDGAQGVCDYNMAYEIKDVFPDELYELWSDRVMEFPVLETVDDAEVYTEKPVVVDIAGTKVHAYFGLSEETHYLLIANLSGHEEYLAKFMQMLYDIETGVIDVD